MAFLYDSFGALGYGGFSCCGDDEDLGVETLHHQSSVSIRVSRKHRDHARMMSGNKVI